MGNSPSGKEKLKPFLGSVESVTTAKEDIRQSIKKPDIAWLLTTSAAETCAGFLASYCAPDAGYTEQQRYEAGELLLILAAMEGESEYDTLEALRVMGARSVDTRGSRYRKDRYRLAGLARERPVSDWRHYERVHLPRMQQRIASELHALVVRPHRLQAALETNGAVAVAKYL